MTRWTRRLIRSGVAVLAVAAIALVAAPPASAHPSHRALNLVVVGDSYSSGEGNAPYLDASGCDRSAAAFGPLLARTGLIRLQAFPACSGATSVTEWQTGQHGEGPQTDKITAATDIVTVQALGNDIHVSQLEGLCIVADCTVAEPATLQAIAAAGPAWLDQLYDHITARPGFHGTVVAVLYPDLFPKPGAPVGPNCPYMTAGELLTAHRISTALDTQITLAAARHGFRVADPRPWFRGRDVCSTRSAFYQPNPATPPSPGWLHPNRFGQALYALTVARALLR